MLCSEVHAAESVAYLNRALVRLQDIWEEIGIPEEQRLQRTNDVHKHIKVSLTKKSSYDLIGGVAELVCTLSCFSVMQGLLDLMIAEEEDLKKRLVKNIETSRKELSHLCAELQLPPFEVE